MKKLGITQRVETISGYEEVRDSLDQRWISLAMALDFVPIPLPNIPPQHVDNLLDTLSLDAILLSGGNTLAIVDPQAPDASPLRDAFEGELINCARDRSLPILGVCRGMQMINVHLGGSLVAVEGHVKTTHPLNFDATFSDILCTSVNSYHKWGLSTATLAACLKSIAVDGDGHVEAFRHESERIAGIMWHPEREAPFKDQDLNLFRRFLS